MPAPNAKSESEQWRDDYAFKIIEQLPSVVNGKLKGKIPDFFSDFMIMPKNPTFGKAVVKEEFFHRPLIIWAPDIFWNRYRIIHRGMFLLFM